MGISAQQHRVCTGLFCTNILKSSGSIVGGKFVWSCLLSRHMFGVCIGIIYMYILTFMMFMNIDCNNVLNEPGHPSIHALPELRSSLNLYFLLICCTILHKHIIHVFYS